MSKISYVGCPGLSVVNLAQFAVEIVCCIPILPKVDRKLKTIFLRSRLSKVIDVCANRKQMHDFLLKIISNLGLILHRLNL